jgi:hypothetical protein
MTRSTRVLYLISVLLAYGFLLSLFRASAYGVVFATGGGMILASPLVGFRHWALVPVGMAIGATLVWTFPKHSPREPLLPWAVLVIVIVAGLTDVWLRRRSPAPPTRP